MSKTTIRAIQVASGAAVLTAGAYLVARRLRASSERAPSVARVPEASQTRAVEERQPRADFSQDLALDVDQMFDVEPQSGVEPTAQPTEHAPAQLSGDDSEPPSPDDLGSAWLAQATESESSATEPNVEELELDPERLAVSPDSDADDETVQEYVRRHRQSSAG